jgi:hypothetical protein
VPESVWKLCTLPPLSCPTVFFHLAVPVSNMSTCLFVSLSSVSHSSELFNLWKAVWQM